MRKVDVLIIGAGSGGLSARREVAKKTDNYLVVDGGILGTTCARVGCMPSKALIQVAEDFYRRKKFLEEGIHGAKELTLNTKEVMQHVRKLRDRFVRGVTSSMKSWEDKLLRGYASFIDDHHVMVNDEKIYAQKIIIATGTKPNIPEVFANHKEFLITTDEFFELEDIPNSLAVIGLGVIGIELGQAVSRLDVNFLGVARRENIAGVTDPKLNEYVLRKFSEQMNLSFKGVDLVEKVGDQLKIKTSDKEILADKVLLTTGRSHNLDQLKISNTSVEVNELNQIMHCEQTFKARGCEHIFIAGDVTGHKQILHEASDEGRIAGFNAVNQKTGFKTRTPLLITFSDPNIAMAGSSYKDLCDKGIDFEVGEVLFEGQGRSIIKLKEIGMLRIYGEKGTGKILGAELMAPDGEHIAHLLSWVIEQNLNVNQVLSHPFYHPVVEEGLRTALRDLRDKLKLDKPKLEIFEMGS